MPRPDDKYQVMIQRTDGSISVIAYMGQGSAKITDGFGGWQVISRPHKTGLTQFNGRNPFQLTLPILFDGYHYKEKVDQQLNVRYLTWLALPPTGMKEPAPVNVYGSALPFPSGGEWLINGLEPGDNTYWEEVDGQSKLFRQDYIVTLLQHIASDRIEFTDPGQGIAPKTPTTYISKEGDSLRSIAQNFYGDYTLWRTIAEANALNDPAHLNVGVRLRIP